MAISLVDAQRGKRNPFAYETVIEEYRGRSSDAKPVLATNRNGSTFFEFDTGDAYMWDGQALSWVLL